MDKESIIAAVVARKLSYAEALKQLRGKMTASELLKLVNASRVARADKIGRR